MNCRVCGSSRLQFLFAIPSGEQKWWRCESCQSETSDTPVAAAVASYDANNLTGTLDRAFTGDRAALVESMRHNLLTFGLHTNKPGRFLDIGCNEGCGMAGMRALGWDSYGFDINPAAAGSQIVCAAEFTADLFDHPFEAIMIREVIEHVDDWQRLLAAAVRAISPGGLLQVQTPRPSPGQDPIPYQWQHLQLFSVRMLQRAILDAGCELLTTQLWEIGQLHMARKVAE